MQSFWNSFWPWLFLFACLGLLVLIGSSISLKREFIRMRQERQEGMASPWHRRLKVRDSLKGIAISLAIIALALWMGAISSLPLRTEDLNMIVWGSLVSIGVCISLLIYKNRMCTIAEQPQRQAKAICTSRSRNSEQVSIIGTLTAYLGVPRTRRRLTRENK